MFIDNLMMLSGSINGSTITGQTVTGTGSVLSTNTADLLQQRDIAEGTDLYGRFEVTTAFAGLTALEMQIITADDAALTSNVTVVGSTGAIPVASLTAANRHVCSLNPRIASRGQRYIGARYVITGTGTAGALVADIGLEVQGNQKYYTSGFAVL